MRLAVRFQWAGRDLKCVPVTVHPIRDRGTQYHYGRMDEHDPVSHSHWPDVHPDPPRVHPPLGRARRVGPRRRTQQPPGWKSDGEHCPGTVLHRGRTRWFVSTLAYFPRKLVCPRLTSSRKTHTVPLGESIASEGKGEYLYVEGRVLTSSGEPIPGAVIETWETDEKGEQHLMCSPFV